MTGGHKGTETCDVQSAVVFLVGLAAGTGCTISSKMLFQTTATNMFGEKQFFTPPLFQTWVMFVGMAFALPAHYIAEWNRRRVASPEERAKIDLEPKVTMQTYAMLGVPSVFDLIATCLMVLGLLHTNASVRAPMPLRAFACTLLGGCHAVTACRRPMNHCRARTHSRIHRYGCCCAAAASSSSRL